METEVAFEQMAFMVTSSSSSSSSGYEMSGITAFASLEMIDLIDCAIARDVESLLLWPSRPRLTNFFNVAVQAHDQSTKN